MKFTASWSKMLKISTWIVLILLCSTSIFMVILEGNSLTVLERPSVWISLSMMIFVLYCYSQAPRYYRLTAEEIEIHRLLSKICIPLKEIQEIREIQGKTNSLLRLMGVGGFFGYYGIYYRKPEGKIRLYATRKDKWVLICLGNAKKFVLSPDDSQFILEVSQRKSQIV